VLGGAARTAGGATGARHADSFGVERVAAKVSARTSSRALEHLRLAGTAVLGGLEGGGHFRHDRGRLGPREKRPTCTATTSSYRNVAPSRHNVTAGTLANGRNRVRASQSLRCLRCSRDDTEHREPGRQHRRRLRHPRAGTRAGRRRRRRCCEPDRARPGAAVDAQPARPGRGSDWNRQDQDPAGHGRAAVGRGGARLPRRRQGRPVRHRRARAAVGPHHPPRSGDRGRLAGGRRFARRSPRSAPSCSPRCWG